MSPSHRGEPRETGRQIRETVGQIHVSDLEKVFEDISEEVPDGDPQPAARKSNGSGGGSSTSSESAQDDVTQVFTGSRGSDTGATWPQTTSAR